MATAKPVPESQNFLALDFETANVTSNSACALGIVRVEKGKIVHQEAFLIRPPSSDFRFTEIHGLTWDDVKDAPRFSALWPRIRRYFDGVDFLAAHNASFDSRILKGCCDHYRLKAPEAPYICSVKVARQVWNIYPTKLPNVCEALNIPLKHHDALSDARACAEIILKSMKAPQVES